MYACIGKSRWHAFRSNTNSFKKHIWEKNSLLNNIDFRNFTKYIIIILLHSFASFEPKLLGEKWHVMWSSHLKSFLKDFQSTLYVNCFSKPYEQSGIHWVRWASFKIFLFFPLTRFKSNCFNILVYIQLEGFQFNEEYRPWCGKSIK